jgi:hypothetical protein
MDEPDIDVKENEEAGDKVDEERESSIYSEIMEEAKEHKEKSLIAFEGQDDFDDFDPLEYLGVYKEKLLSSDEEGDGDHEALFDENIKDENEIGRLSFFNCKDNISVTGSNENHSKCLNFSDINSKLKNSNLSLTGGNATDNLAVSSFQKKENQIKNSPKKSRRIPFVKNLSPETKVKTNRFQTTESNTEIVNSKIYNEKYSSVTSKYFLT